MSAERLVSFASSAKAGGSYRLGLGSPVGSIQCWTDAKILLSPSKDESSCKTSHTPHTGFDYFRVIRLRCKARSTCRQFSKWKGIEQS